MYEAATTASVIGATIAHQQYNSRMKPTPEQIKEYSDSLETAKFEEKVKEWYNETFRIAAIPYENLSEEGKRVMRSRYVSRCRKEESSQLTENNNLPPCPCCLSNERVTVSPKESEFRGKYFCPCNEPGANLSGHFNISSLPASRSLLHADEKHEQFAEDLSSVLLSLETMLLEKNKAYGDSALSPIGIFARGNPEDLIRVRLDDKITRIKNIGDGDVEDAEWDLMGYLVLLRIAKMKRKQYSVN